MRALGSWIFMLNYLRSSKRECSGREIKCFFINLFQLKIVTCFWNTWNIRKKYEISDRKLLHCSIRINVQGKTIFSRKRKARAWKLNLIKRFGTYRKEISNRYLDRILRINLWIGIWNLYPKCTRKNWGQKVYVLKSLNYELPTPYEFVTHSKKNYLQKTGTWNIIFLENWVF